MAESFAEVVTRLGKAQKGRARGAPAYSVHVNRPVGRLLAAGAYLWGLTPNKVTGVSAVFTFTGIALICLAPPSALTSIVIWLLLALGYAWDSADGQVARLRGGGSLEGEWLDHVVDAAKLLTLHLAVLVGLFRFADLDPLVLLLPLAFTTVNGVTFFAMLLNDLLKSARGAPSSAARGGASLARSLVLLPTDYGVLCLVFVLWWNTTAFVAAYSLLLVASAAFLLLALPRWFGEMRRLSRETRASDSSSSAGGHATAVDK